jgi:hypothetical protein
VHAFGVLEPAALGATALADADATHRQRLAAFELAMERARFDAERAQRQFDAVEPENRIVARILERVRLGGCVADIDSSRSSVTGKKEVATECE